MLAHLVFAAGTATVSLTPSTATFSQGDTVSVDIYEDSGSDTINAVQANFSYPSNILSFVGVTDSPAFSVVAQNSVSGGSAKVARGTSTPVSGNQLVATVRFTASGAGSATLSFTSGTAVVRSTDNGAETLTTNGASYTINSRASLYITPATKTFTKGNDVAAAIYEDSGPTAVNAVQADLNYPSNLLTFTSIDTSSSAFPVAAQGSGGSGSVKIGRGATTPVTGAQLVAIVHFTAAAAGTANISFANTSAVIRSSDNGPEALTETGASYTLNNPSTPNTGGTNTTPTTSKTTTNTTTKPAGNTSSSPSSNPAQSQVPVTTNDDTKAPVISQITITNLSLHTATITWQTSEPATSEVDYGLSTKYILNVVDPKLTKNHSVELNSKDLEAHKTYHFQVKSVDKTGNLAFSKDMTFITEPASSKSSYGSFWAAFAAVVIIAAAAYVGAGYIRRMKAQALKPGPQVPVTPNNSRQGGGAVIKPDTSSTPTTPDAKPVTIAPSATIIKPEPAPQAKTVTVSQAPEAKSGPSNSSTIAAKPVISPKDIPPPATSPSPKK